VRFPTDQGSAASMGEEGAREGEEIVMPPGEEEVLPRKPADKNRELVKKMLDGCLKHGLAALCKEKPEEPIKWLAHWLLENNPNQPRVRNPARAAPGSLARAARHARAPMSGRVALLPVCARATASSVCWRQGEARLHGVLILTRCAPPPGHEARKSAAREGPYD